MTGQVNKRKSQAISKNIRVFNQAADCKFDRNSKINGGQAASGYGGGYQPLRATKHATSTSYSSVNFTNTSSTINANNNIYSAQKHISSNPYYYAPGQGQQPKSILKKSGSYLRLDA